MSQSPGGGGDAAPPSGRPPHSYISPLTAPTTTTTTTTTRTTSLPPNTPMRPTTLDAFDVDLHTPRPRPRRSKRPRRSRGLEYARLVRGEKQKRRPSREPAVDWEPYWWEDRVGHNMMCSHCWCCVGIPYPWEELGWSWRDGWWNEDARADPDFFYRYYYCVHGVECWEDDDDGWSVIEGAEAGVLEPEEVEVPDGWRVVCRHRGARCVP